MEEEIYDKKYVKDLFENDEINAEEEGFMLGYERADYNDN